MTRPSRSERNAGVPLWPPRAHPSAAAARALQSAFDFQGSATVANPAGSIRASPAAPPGEPQTLTWTGRDAARWLPQPSRPDLPDWKSPEPGHSGPDLRPWKQPEPQAESRDTC